MIKNKGLRLMLVVITLIIMTLTNTICTFAAETTDTAIVTAKVTTFSDVKDSAWYKNYLDLIVAKDGIGGYSDGTFKPSETITVAEFIKITVSMMLGEQEKTGTHWASGYMDTAVNTLEIVPDGMFTEADWDEPIERQKMAVIMEKVAEVIYKETTITDSTTLSNIQASVEDYSRVSDYCKDYIVQAIGRGLITGYIDGTFGPEKTATRAEATTMLARLINNSYRVTKDFSVTTTIEADTVHPISELTSDPVLLNLLQMSYNGKVVYSFYDGYEVLNDASRFGFTLVSDTYETTITDEDRRLASLGYKRTRLGYSFAVSYFHTGELYTLDENYNFLGSNVLSTQGQAIEIFGGKLSDTAYFLFGEDDMLYLVPNTLH